MVLGFSSESCSDKLLKMEGSGSRSKREGKRRIDEGDDDDYGRGSAPKQQKIPSFVRVVMEALKMEGLEKLFLYFEPFIRKIFREEMQQCLLKNDDPGKLESLIHKILYEELQSAMKTYNHGNLAGGSSPPRIQESGGRKLQLRFETKMPDRLFAGKKVEGEGGSAIYVKLIDLTDSSVVKTGPESTAKLNVLVLQGDFDEDFNDGWTPEIFKSHQVKERDGNGPILIGDIQVTLKDGVGILGDLLFTDNSSWTRTKKFRLGVELAPGFCEGTCVMEAKTEAFAVLDQRGESYKKHYPPALQDEVYRLKGIAKGKPLHEKLVNAGIITVEDLLRLHSKDPRKLRNMLGTGMTDNKWKNTIEHAKTCDFSGGKCYVFYTDESESFGIMFNHIHALKGLITDGKVLPLESLAQTKEVSSLVKKAYENWKEVIEYDDHVLQSFTTTKEIEACREEQACSINHNATHTPINHQYSTPESIRKNQSDNMSEQPQFGFPLVNANQTHMEVPFNNSESFVGSSMYTAGETSGAGCSNSLKDWLQPNNEQGLENFLDDEMMEKLPFVGPDVGFYNSSTYITGETSGAGCSYISEDWLPPNNSQRMESLVDDEIENTEFYFGVGLGEEVGLAAIFGHSNEARYSYDKEAEPKYDESFEVDPFVVENRMNRGKAVFGWLKIKVALRWGIMLRKIAAERRAQLTELH